LASDLTGELTASAAARWARESAEATPDRLRKAHARAFCVEAVGRYWQLTHGRRGRTLRPWAAPAKALRSEALDAALALGEAAADTSVDAAAYALGCTYAAMLPPDARSRDGVYYTPPPLVERLLDSAEAAGVDWETARVLDPACGGGAFVGPVAARMVRALHRCDRRLVTRNVAARVHGMEIDPFAAWLSQVFFEATLHGLLGGAGADIADVAEVCDSLRRPEPADFDLVIGNPPYGRVSLDAQQRSLYRRSLFGHANLYGIFLDLAVRKTRPDAGVIAYVTPTSFLSGEYFKRLRELLAVEANPVSLSLVHERAGVFDGVLQETMLAVFRRGEVGRRPDVHFLEAGETAVRAEAIGKVALPQRGDDPWLLPRSLGAASLATRLPALPTRLADWGYKVSTGPLVWNRHKGQLRARAEAGAVPLIWAEAVGPDGDFAFRAARRNHLPYFLPSASDGWLLVRRGCVLLQRTTAKEQPRRLIAAELPPTFVAEHGAVTVENHLNMLVPIAPEPAIDTATLAAFLNSGAADRVFRCISGSVAVSAYELEAMPLPRPSAMMRFASAVARGLPRAEVDRVCDEAYALE
jgi:adenine-specific DNA-methyltransferase